MKKRPIYGVIAEFDTADGVLNAAQRAYAEGYREMDAYTPFPVEGLAEAIGFHQTYVPLICLIGGLMGCAGGFFLQWWPNVIGYPLNIGGRPYNSWPQFIPITFELTVLLAGLATVFGMLALNGFPEPYHPVFNAKNFELASRDKFFLCIEARDEKFEAQKTREFLLSLNAHEVSEIEG
jgi:hypothetical protein